MQVTFAESEFQLWALEHTRPHWPLWYTFTTSSFNLTAFSEQDTGQENQEFCKLYNNTESMNITVGAVHSSVFKSSAVCDCNNTCILDDRTTGQSSFFSCAGKSRVVDGTRAASIAIQSVGVWNTKNIVQLAKVSFKAFHTHAPPLVLAGYRRRELRPHPGYDRRPCPILLGDRSPLCRRSPSNHQPASPLLRWNTADLELK